MTTITLTSTITSNIIKGGGAQIPPSNLTAPLISGSAIVGQTLSVSDGTWAGSPVITFSYQWKRNGSNIGGAIGNTYTLDQADAATTITCEVTATNIAGSASALSSNSLTVLDADANAFITAAALTDSTQITAVNVLTVDLKNYNIWTKFIAIYPYVGGTATTHKWNLKNPLDTNAAFRIVWNGGVTHNSDGITGNGTNGYGETYIIPSTSMSLNDSHISFYSRTNIQTTTNDIGVADTLGNRGINIVARTTTNVSQYYVNDFNINAVSNNNGDGFFVATRTASNVKKLFRNGNTLSSVTTASVSLPAVSIPVLGRKNYNGMNGYVAKNHSFASIGSGLTDTDIVNLSWINEQYQTTLGRSVNPWYNNGNLLLDNYPSAAVAYSVRKLRNYYIGAAIRVRRSSDNAEQDIYFDSTGNLDTASLLSFVGAGDGFVTTWYDQSGNGYNSIQATAANQPIIVNSGVLEVNANNKPAIRFIDTSTVSILASMSSTLWYPATVTYIGVFSVYQLNNLTYTNYIQGSGPNASRGFHILHTNTGQPRTITYRTATTTGTGTALNANQVYLRYDTANRVNIQTYINGSGTPNINIADTNTNFGTLTSVINGSNAVATVTSDTPISEFVGYITDQTANKTGIETNIKNYFGI